MQHLDAHTRADTEMTFDHLHSPATELAGTDRDARAEAYEPSTSNR